MNPLNPTELHASVSDPLLDAMTFLNEIANRYPEAVSLAPGRPFEDLYSLDSVTTYLETYLDHLRGSGYTERQVRTALFQYGRTKGQIHDLIATVLANDEGIHVSPESVVVTVGAQEGMILVLRALFARPEDALLVVSPCYVGMTGAARLLDVPVVPVVEGRDGLDPDAVCEAIHQTAAAGQRPRALYVVPDFANPSGVSMPVATRRKLLDMAAAEDVLIIEDNPYGYFVRDVEPRPTLKSLDQERTVVYLGSFAKTCFPGARVGYIVADQHVRDDMDRSGLLADELAKIKSMITVNTPSLSQAVIGGMLLSSGCRLRQANAEAIGFYRENLRTVLAELERHFPTRRRSELGVEWTCPDGGFFTVLSVPFPADEAALERSAREHGVLWTPMESFFVGGGGRNQLRISSSYLPTAEVAEGVARLAGFIAAETARASGRVPEAR